MKKSPVERRCLDNVTRSVLRQTSANASVIVLSKVRNVVVDGFTITGANGSPSLLIEECDASVQILHCAVSGNVSQMAGAGIRVAHDSNPQVFNCKISGNRVMGGAAGAGIFIDETSSGVWSHCIVAQNQTDGESGGGAWVEGQE